MTIMAAFYVKCTTQGDWKQCGAELSSGSKRKGQQSSLHGAGLALMHPVSRRAALPSSWQHMQRGRGYDLQFR